MTLATLFHWVREREAIRVRKERGDPFPWTDDPILRDWRFCNVRREDDRVTRWIHRNVRERYADHPLLWLMLCASRQLNWPPTLERLIDDGVPSEERMYPGAWFDDPSFEPRLLGEALEDLASMDLKVFTGAYIVTAPTERGAKKAHHVANVTLGALWRERDLAETAMLTPGTLRNAHAWLTRFPGWGPFLAYQAVVDMRFCPKLLAAAPDRETWAAAGPGTIRGLNRLHGRRLEAPVPQERALREMLPLRELIPAETGVTIDLSDVPNVLCEVDKFLRVKNGEGTPRARYVPGRGW